jgi:O-antigen/teichoic acid export membrane protein
MYVFGSYLTATSRFKTLIIIVSLGVILALGCYLYFIPLYKALGAAAVAAGVQLTMGTLHLLAAGYYIYQDHKK